MILGQGDRTSTLTAVRQHRRTCGAEDPDKFGKEKSRSKTACQHSKDEDKTTMDAQVRHPTSMSLRAKVTLKHHGWNAQCTHQRPAMPLEPALCNAMHVIYWAAFKPSLFDWRTVWLSTSWSGAKCLGNEDDNRQEQVCRRKKVTLTVRMTRTLSKDASYDAPCGGFPSFSSLGLFLFGNHAL